MFYLVNFNRWLKTSWDGMVSFQNGGIAHLNLNFRFAHNV